jgi:DNA-binding GntR family transcriptional regulator
MRDAEHRAIFEAVKDRDAVEAAGLLARHLSRTALTLMAQLAPEHEPLTVRTALQFVSGRSSELS